MIRFGRLRVGLSRLIVFGGVFVFGEPLLHPEGFAVSDPVYH
jgi:hypothetical protein